MQLPGNITSQATQHGAAASQQNAVLGNISGQFRRCLFQNSMNSLQSVSIIAAFPIGIIILIIVASFFKDASSYLRERKDI